MPTLPATKKKPPKPFRIGLPEQKILHALLRYHYLTAEQLARLLFRQTSLTYVQQKLKVLHDAKFCVYGYDLRGGRLGKSRYAWTLGRKGLNYLTAEGLDVQERFDVGEATQVKTLFLEHTFAVNDFFISLERLCRLMPDRLTFDVLQDFTSERVIKRKPPYVTILVGDGERRKPVRKPVIADGFVVLRLVGKGRIPLAPEIDRGTEAQGKFRQKIAALVAFACNPSEALTADDGTVHQVTPLEKVYGVRKVTIPVLTTEGAKRAQDLQRWTEAELTELGRKDQRDMFFFTAGRPDLEPPADVFLGHRWTYAFSSDPGPLIPLEGGA